MGAVAIGSLTAVPFFFRFWRRTRGRFFLCFALSFWLEAANRITLGLFIDASEDAAIICMVRLVAYGLILYAVWYKNRTR